MSIVTSSDRIGIVSIGGYPIEICGTSQAKSAIKEFSKYGLITFSRVYSFKSSYYSIHFIKPVAKLKQLYNLGEEVLILCCNDALANFKSRTKDFIDYLLVTRAEYRNRLDKVTCFVIDNCDNVEEIIKVDREKNPDARLIVPFAYAELENGLDDEQLQNRLRAFLYERDLFGIASPLKDDNLFFGKDRINIISELYGKYLQGEHGGLFGLRRIGKTSVLNLVCLRVEQGNGAVVYFDCSKYHHLRWNSFLHQIIQDIYEKYSSSDFEANGINLPSTFILPEASSRYNEAKATISFESDLASLYQGLGNKRILLIFDEIEQISYTTSPSDHWRDGNDSLFFWQAIRSTSQMKNQLLAFVIAGVNPKCVEIAKINKYPNPIFNALTPQYISLFDLDDVRKMVSDIGGHLGLHLEEEIFTRLIDDYGGHPFLTRQVCSKINLEILKREEPRPYLVSKYSYEKHAKDYQAKMESVIEQILGVLQDYYPSEYELLKTLALNGSATFKQQLKFGEGSISHLLGYCLIQKSENDYFIRIRSIADYIRGKYRYEQLSLTPSEKRTRISIRRNDLEEKLRSIIQYELNMKYGKKAKEQLINLLKGTTKDETQISKMQAADFKGAMQEVYFIQLKLIITKNWKYYQAIFSDRVKFEEFLDIINRCRVDAHAKELDDEDEALLNIAFKFFEKSLINF